MGLSIHYSGRFKKDASLIEMIEEVKDIANIYGWEYTIGNTHFPENSFESETYDDEIYGIYFSPPQCETISITFLSNGKMSSIPNVMFYGNSNDPQHKIYLYTLSAKTQFAGSVIHKVVIHLIRYLSNKYIDEFKMTDEGQYWETMDEAILEQNFKRHTAVIDGVADSLNNLPKEPSESFDNYIERILKIIKEKKTKE